MKKRESYIEKHIEMVVNLGNYESLRVGSTFGETIEWETPEERQTKLNSITENLKREVAKDVNDVLKSYGLGKKSSVKLDSKTKMPFKEDVSNEAENIDEKEIIKTPKAEKVNCDDVEIKIDDKKSAVADEDEEFNL